MHEKKNVLGLWKVRKDAFAFTSLDLAVVHQPKLFGCPNSDLQTQGLRFGNLGL